MLINSAFHFANVGEPSVLLFKDSSLFCAPDAISTCLLKDFSPTFIPPSHLHHQNSPLSSIIPINAQKSCNFSTLKKNLLLALYPPQTVTLFLCSYLWHNSWRELTLLAAFTSLPPFLPPIRSHQPSLLWQDCLCQGFSMLLNLKPHFPCLFIECESSSVPPWCPDYHPPLLVSLLPLWLLLHQPLCWHFFISKA